MRQNTMGAALYNDLRSSQCDLSICLRLWPCTACLLKPWRRCGLPDDCRVQTAAGVKADLILAVNDRLDRPNRVCIAVAAGTYTPKYRVKLVYCMTSYPDTRSPGEGKEGKDSAC